MNVNYIIEGSVGREENNLKIWVQLINAKTDKHVWANDYTREMKQIFSLQSEIAKEIASELKTVLSPEEKIRLIKSLLKTLKHIIIICIGNEYYWRSYEKQNLRLQLQCIEKQLNQIQILPWLISDFPFAIYQYIGSIMIRVWNRVSKK